MRPAKYAAKRLAALPVARCPLSLAPPVHLLSPTPLSLFLYRVHFRSRTFILRPYD